MLIAIDAGGTKTDFALVNLNGTVENRVTGEGCNLTDCGIQRTSEVLKAGLDKLLEKTNANSPEILAAFAGVSGGTVGNNKPLMNNLLRQLLPFVKTTLSDSDVINALSSGIEAGDGCVVISGTGTSGFVRVNKAVSRIGGWGYLFDKGGSGYDFGRDAMYHVLCEYDGRGPSTMLTALVTKALGEPPSQAVTKLYHLGKPSVAALAPLVFQAEKAGDSIAKEIMQANALEMAKLMNTLSAQLKDKACKTVLAGSMFKDFDVLKPYLLPHLKAEHEFVFPSLPPIYGSAVEALALTNKGFTPLFKENFAASFKNF